MQKLVIISNQTKREIKAIEAWLLTTRKDGKKKPKVEKAGSHQQYFQGARFPLPGGVDYDGAVGYPLPKDLEATTDSVSHAIVISLPFTGALRGGVLKAVLPLKVVK